ncbi:MAG: PHB depolymerase family esterase, partial [Bacteroidota bacterium]|nr:PHB depolymerase family esterase [Bacteroidota bacterium]
MKNITYFLMAMVSLFSLAQVSELRTIQHDGNNRQFFLYVPTSYNQDNATPVMFNFHGGGGTASAHLNYTSDMRNLAESENFILVYPQASPDPSSNVNSWIDKAGSNKNDIYFIEAIFNNLNTIYNIDDSRVYACGYSEGAIFTYELACRLSNIITGVATVAGSMLTD